MPDMQNQISLGPLFRCACPLFALSTMDPLVSLFLPSFSFSPSPPFLSLASVFGIFFLRSVAADPAFVSRCCCCSR